MISKNTTNEIFGVRLKQLRKQNGYTIEQFAKEIGVAKSTVGYYENENRMPDIEILSRICDLFNVPADYLLGRTNTAASKGKMKAVCELTGLSDMAADFLSELIKHKRYETLDMLNFLLEDFADDFNEDYDMQGDKNLENASSVLNAVLSYMEKYSSHISSLDFMEIEDVVRQRKVETVYRELMIRRIIDSVKVCTEEYDNRRRPCE